MKIQWNLTNLSEDQEVIEVVEAGDDIVVQVLSRTLFRNTR